MCLRSSKDHSKNTSPRPVTDQLQNMYCMTKCVVMYVTPANVLVLLLQRFFCVIVTGISIDLATVLDPFSSTLPHLHITLTGAYKKRQRVQRLPTLAQMKTCASVVRCNLACKYNSHQSCFIMGEDEPFRLMFS